MDALSTVRGLRVRGRGYAGASEVDVVETGRRLGVDVVVDGSVRRAGALLRVSARLVGVEDGFQIWSSRFERPAAQAFALNDEVAGAISGALSAEQPDAHDRAGRILLEVDLWDEAIAHLDRALWLDQMQPWARIDRMRAAALSGEWAQAQAIYESGSGGQWESHGAIHRARFWSWPDAPPLGDIPELATLRPETRAMLDGYHWAREKRRAGESAARDEFDAALVDLTKNAPAARARRFIAQMLSEQAAIVENFPVALEFLTSAVDGGLLDLGWMNRQRLLDPLRTDPAFEALRQKVAERAVRVSDAWRGSLESVEEAVASI